MAAITTAHTKRYLRISAKIPLDKTLTHSAEMKAETKRLADWNYFMSLEPISDSFAESIAEARRQDSEWLGAGGNYDS
ncbi:MAG: hypothetical protein LBN97_02425 [Oscillospiraceae bacterium]|jgi:hypothetical protein|nr:hypothetical protein [Oscillospiraceae bacterium]